MLRKLTPSERMDLLLASDFANVFAVTARVRGSCSPDELERAVRAAAARHPQLRVRVPVGRVARLSSIGVPYPPVRVAAPGARWQAAVAAELQQPFSLRRGPLTRFVLIPGPEHLGPEHVGPGHVGPEHLGPEHLDTEREHCNGKEERLDGNAEYFDLLVVTHHLIADGRALVLLVRELLRQLAGEPIPDGVLEPPSPWQLTDTRPDPAPAPPPPPVDRQRSAAPGGEREVGPFEVLAVTLDARRTAALVGRCRQESTTVHAALCVAFARGLAEAVPGPSWRRLGCPFSLRELLPVEAGDAFGSYQGPPAQLTVQTHTPADFWADARRVKAELNRQTAPATVRLATRYLRALSLLPPPVARRLLRRLVADDPDLWISNLGELPIPTTYAELALTEVRLVVRTGPPGRRVLGVTGIGGRLLLTLACADRAGMERMMDRALAQLDRALDTRPAGVQRSSDQQLGNGRVAEPELQRPGP